MTGQPVPPSELPDSATCALTRDGHLTADDCWQIERFRQFLADRKAVRDFYAQRIASLPVGDLHRDRLSATCRADVASLLDQYEADTTPKDNPR